MNAETHSQLANFIWSICNLLRGPYKRNEYRKVILPLTVSKRPFYNLSKLDFAKLLDDPNQLAPNLNGYISKFSPNVRGIMERFAFDQQIARMAEKNLLYEVIKAFAKIDLSSDHVDNVQMGYVFEELIRIGAEQANEEAGEHFTPREVIKLMVNLLLSPEKDLRRSHVVKTIYDPACGTGGMLSVAEKYIRDLNADANPHLYGQDWNDESWTVCQSDMLIKGEDAKIVLDDTFTKDAFDRDDKGKKITFDYMLANPPFGVEWKQQEFKVSPIVAARRALDLGLVDQPRFFGFYRAYQTDERRTAAKAKGGGDFYNNQNMRLGKRFARAVMLAAKEGRLLYREAYSLTGLQGATFDKYAEGAAQAKPGGAQETARTSLRNIPNTV